MNNFFEVIDFILDSLKTKNEHQKIKQRKK